MGFAEARQGGPVWTVGQPEFPPLADRRVAGNGQLGAGAVVGQPRGEPESIVRVTPNAQCRMGPRRPRCPFRRSEATSGVEAKISGRDRSSPTSLSRRSAYRTRPSSNLNIVTQPAYGRRLRPPP
jgi:hypothetical protein